MADRTVPADRDKWIKFAAQPADLSNGLVGSGLSACRSLTLTLATTRLRTRFVES